MPRTTHETRGGRCVDAILAAVITVAIEVEARECDLSESVGERFCAECNVEW